MHILKNITKKELDSLTKQPTAKKLINTIKEKAIYIPDGDEQSALKYTEMRKNDLVQISDQGRNALKEQQVKNSKGLNILSENQETGEYSLRFDNTAYVYRAIEKGSITVDGKEIVLDDQTKDKLRNAADMVSKAQEAATELALLQHNTMVAQQQSEAMNKAAKEQQKLFEIAMRIMKGGKVPPEDERKLAQAYPEMYQTAKSMAMMNRNKEKKEYDSVDEDDKNNVSEAEKEESGNTDSPLEHVDRHFVDINVTMGSDGGSVDAVSTETVSSL